MGTTTKRTFSLSRTQTEMIDRLVSSGGYASASEVVRAGLRALEERDDAVERWLGSEVVPVARAMEAEPSRGLSSRQVRDDVLALHERRVAEKRRGA